MKNFERNTSWVLLFSLTIMLTVQIIARYIFFTSINWIEEFSRIIFIWFIYLSISWIITQGRHIRVTALALTRQVALELGAHGITVNAVAPANVNSPRGLANRSPERIVHIEKTTPLRRLSEPEEIASAVAFLCSREASYITGVTLDANGGATMAP